MRRWLITGAVVLLAACGGGGGSKTSATRATTTTTVPPTTAKPAATLSVEPTAGKVGTTFTLTMAGAVGGETVTFHIRFPDNRVRDGQGHTVAPDGTLNATYVATAGNPNGEYQVSATGTQGTQAAATFTLGPTTGVPSTATTKGRVTTTTTRHA